MSYRELVMIDVKEVLRRWSAGHSNRKISRETGTHRTTAARYIAAAQGLGIEPGHEFTDDEVHEIAQRVQARPLRDPSEVRRTLDEHKARIAEWLSRKRPLRLTKIHVLLQRQGVEVSYDTLRRYAAQEFGWHKKAPTVRLDDPPAGQEAQIDFGKMGMIRDEDLDRMRVLWALVVTLSFSRYQFVWPTFVQTTAAVCEGLDRAWSFFGAMARTIVPDNTRAIVKDPDALSPTLVSAFLDYVQARGIFADPARVRAPQDKARVENQVPYVRESWFDGESFIGLDDARRSAEHWCAEIAGRRIHGTTRKVPREVFESTERATMLPAPSEPFDVPVWVDAAKVHPDHHIQVARALYSVPTLYRNKTVRARADQKLVKIYFGTELIKVHERKPPGGRSTDPHDYPVGKAEYALRSVDNLVARGHEQGEHIGIYVERLLEGPLPWTRMRQAYALLRLCDKYGVGRVEAVCQSALAFDVINVHRITQKLKRASKLASTSEAGGKGKVVQLELPRFARPESHFETQAGSTKKGGA
jgi:transposase